MYRILIVDDEPIFRLGIQSCVDWANLGFQVAGEADNGKKAVELIDQLEPDLVFLDIKMPQMDGIQVLQWLQTRQRRPVVVVLSCLNEYEYVRQAMRLGALDYLFKPLMGPDDIARVATETIQHFTTQSAAPALPAGARLINALNTGKLDLPDELILQELAALGLEQLQSPLRVAAVYLFFDRNQGRETAIAAVRERLVCAFERRCACIGEHHGMLLFVYRAIEPEELKKFCGELWGSTGVHAALGYSLPLDGPAGLAEGISQAMDAAGRHFISGYESIAEYRAHTVQNGEQVLEAGRRDIDDALREGNPEKAARLLRQTLTAAAEAGYGEPDTLCRFTVSCLMWGIHAWRRRLVLETLISERFEQLSALYCAGTLSELTERFENLLAELFSYVRPERETSISPAIHRVQEYVYQNYQHSITLEQIAQLVHMNKNYFCKLFKKETGESFVSYLTRVRIEHAFALLAQKKFPAYQVAEKVGYSDYQYFCRLYKKYTGVTPRDTAMIADGITEQ